MNLNFPFPKTFLRYSLSSQVSIQIYQILLFLVSFLLIIFQLCWRIKKLNQNLENSQKQANSAKIKSPKKIFPKASLSPLLQSDQNNSTIVLSFSSSNDQSIQVRKHTFQRFEFSTKGNSDLANFFKDSCQLDLDNLETLKGKIETSGDKLKKEFNLNPSDVVLVKKPSSDKFQVSFTNEGFRKVALHEFQSLSQRNLLSIQVQPGEAVQMHFTDGKFANSFDELASLGSGSFGMVLLKGFPRSQQIRK